MNTGLWNMDSGLTALPHPGMTTGGWDLSVELVR
jgi:hypothetical protein